MLQQALCAGPSVRNHWNRRLQLHSLFSCSHFLRSHPNTFLGSDFCSWLVGDTTAIEFNVKTRQAALACGVAMVQNKVICVVLPLHSPAAETSSLQIAHHISDEHGFEETDKYFYRFYSDEAPKLSPRTEKKDEAHSDSACAFLQNC